MITSPGLSPLQKIVSYASSVRFVKSIDQAGDRKYYGFVLHESCKGPVRACFEHSFNAILYLKYLIHLIC